MRTNPSTPKQHPQFILPIEEQADLSVLLSQSHRKYHNINHINDLLSELTVWWNASPLHRTSPALSAYEIYKTLSYMIWYHDAVYLSYQPYFGYNEEMSAELFYKTHIAKYSDFWKELVWHGILATAKHTETQTLDYEGSELVYVMLDMDLAGLGKPFHIFGTNSLAIREEYPLTNNIDFLNGRLKFFKMMYARERIYYMNYFYDRYEKTARENMEYEMEVIQKALANNDAAYYYTVMKYKIEA